MRAYFFFALATVLLASALFNSVKELGKREQRLEQQGADSQAYKAILEAIQNETSDPDDDAAAIAKLCGLAGLSEDDELCSVHRDQTSSD